MPIETFTVFVAEQAVGIAIGVVAVAAAPKIVPGLARTAQNVKQRGTELALDSANGLNAAVVPVKTAGESVYAQVVGGLHWYGEQWDGLIADARAMHTVPMSGSGERVAAVVATAPPITDLPGYLRVELKQVRGNPDLADDVATLLNTLPGVTKVRVSHASGNVLLLYDTEQYPSADSLRQTIAASQIKTNLDTK
ncbi:MAG: hypothetical protein M9941_11140 [Anaerolineae bacterium]|nr:hypothetical protein [Anaerolineae bacterium]